MKIKHKSQKKQKSCFPQKSQKNKNIHPKSPKKAGAFWGQNLQKTAPQVLDFSNCFLPLFAGIILATFYLFFYRKPDKKAVQNSGF